jgi:hypothetical protein
VKPVEIRNIKDLAKYLNSPEGQSKLINQSNIKQALNSEAQRLQTYLVEEINDHLNNFIPEYYHRTGAWLESIRVNPVQQIGNAFIITITFDDEFAYHPSVAGGDDGYVPWLMEVGWKNHDYKTPHFQGFEGTHYIKKAVERWNADNKFGFHISVYHGDERYI